MPTPYTRITEERAIEEFIKKVEREEGIREIFKPNPPDFLIRTKSERTVWGDVTSVLRDKQLAEFLNQHGLNDIGEANVMRSECFQNYSAYIAQIANKIKTRVLKKDAKNSYRPFLKEHGKGSLILYIDDPLFGARDLNALLALGKPYLDCLQQFDLVFLFVPSTHEICCGEDQIRTMGGLHLLSTCPIK